MVEAKLRVETVENSNIENPFYGKTLVKKVTEETFYHDKDVRKEIAPCGIKATLKLVTWLWILPLIAIIWSMK
jgi:hypothetical protein